MVPPIVETRVISRYDTSTPFYQMTDAAAANIYSGPLLDNGSYSETRVLSGDELTYTYTYTYNNLTTYSIVESLQADYRIAFSRYFVDNGFTSPVFTQTGITVPFTVVTTYNFTGAADLVATAISELTAVITGGFAPTILSINATSDSIVTTHQYSNSANFAESIQNELLVTFTIATHDHIRSVFVNRSMQYALV